MELWAKAYGVASAIATTRALALPLVAPLAMLALRAPASEGAEHVAKE